MTEEDIRTLVDIFYKYVLYETLWNFIIIVINIFKCPDHISI